MSIKNWDKGQLNLLILGIGTTLIAGATLTVSLLVYRNSGDIYLDRSRPGYLPEEDEIKEEKTDADFVYADSGDLDRSELDEYLKAMQTILEHLEESTEPYSAEPLSDKSLGIPSAEKPPDKTKEDKN